jgi:hypothetical protein
MTKEKRPNCSDYRQEMMLLGLKKRLAQEDLSAAEKNEIEAKIRELEDKILEC